MQKDEQGTNPIIKLSHILRGFNILSDLELGDLDPRVIREGLLQRREKDGTRCLTCSHKCLIRDNKVGVCGTRVNIEGSVKTLVYGNISSISNNPIEKKPFFHFVPGTMAFTVGSWGCNASCKFCQNFSISRQKPNANVTEYMSPEQFIEHAQAARLEGISISFSEAATLMLEWNLDVFKLAKERDMYTTIVTNGYMTPEAIDLMVDAGLDAANVDVKGCEPQVRRVCGIALQPVLDNIVHMKDNGIHVELTTLVVPGLSDDMGCLEAVVSWIIENTGTKTPWHINRYYPAYRYSKPATRVALLLETRDMAREKGLEFAYIGNVGRRGFEDTICPSCHTLCIERIAMTSHNLAVDRNGKCTQCGHDLNIDFQNHFT